MTWRPSIRAAIASTWFTVTTPVPPMPIMRSEKSSPSTTGSGSGRPLGGAGASCFARFAGITVRKDGQSPSTQE